MRVVVRGGGFYLWQVVIVGGGGLCETLDVNIYFEMNNRIEIIKCPIVAHMTHDRRVPSSYNNAAAASLPMLSRAAVSVLRSPYRTVKIPLSHCELPAVGQ